MYKLLLFSLCLLLSASAFAQNAGKKDKKKDKTVPVAVTPPVVTVAKPVKQVPVLKTPLDSASYAYGIIVGQSIKRQIPFELNYELLLEATKAVFKNDTMLMQEGQTEEIFGKYYQKAQAGPGEDFLAKNKVRPGVTTTASGLQYEVMVKGTGTAHPAAESKVKVHYHGTLIDGTVFDSSVQRGEPITFGLNQVIPGWTEGVQLMSPGDKFKFYLPYQLAYGERGAGGSIKPFSALIFEVELIEIVP